MHNLSDTELVYYYIYKPFMMLSQFTTDLGKRTLADLDYDFPTNVYPIGRLDEESEGLLILTNDKNLSFKLLEPKFNHNRVYIIQVEGSVTEDAIEELCSPMELNIKGISYTTLPAKAEQISEPDLPERTPPIRFRQNIPTSWIKLSIQEGKNHQVRKMTAKVGFPTLRLIRIATEKLTIDKMQPGEVKKIDNKTLYQKLNIA